MESTVKSDSLLILNDDCLHLIFSYIGNIRERLRLMRVCKRFGQLIECGLKTDPIYLHMHNILYPNEFKNARKFEAVKFKSSQLFGACSKIFEFHNEILDFTEDEDEGLLGFSGSDVSGLSHVIKLVLRARHIRRFRPNLVMDKIDSDLAEVQWLLSRCSQLKTLHAYDFHFDSFVLKMIPKSLVNLSLIDISSDPNDFDHLLSTHGSGLKSFKYSRRAAIPLEFDRTVVACIAIHCPNLEKIELSLTYPDLNFFGSFKQLRHISIEGVGLRKVFYEKILEDCPNLTYCKFAFKDLPSNAKDLMIQWKIKFPNLKEIQFEPEKILSSQPLALCM